MILSDVDLSGTRGENMVASAGHKPNIEIACDSDELAHRSIELFVSDAKKAIQAKDVFCVAISGGNTPRHFFELLSEEPRAKSLAWNKIHLFWVDERYVPPDSQWSNYKLAADTFLKKVPIPKENVHRIVTDYCDFNIAAREYERTIRDVFGLAEKQVPVFDLIMLGMGEEGHTGSLFPDSYAPFDTEDLACVVYALDEKLTRITLTHPILCAAAHIAVLVSGEEKAKILKEVLTSEPDEVRYPIHILWRVLDKVIWLVDRQAAKEL
ncbi:6-phosphogluconolactonase [bacterium]|nr:MAG: 6-phosphogluconolactonase [bacterium]